MFSRSSVGEIGVNIREDTETSILIKRTFWFLAIVSIFQRSHARMRYSFTIRQLRQLNINFNLLFILALFLIVSPLVDIVFNQSLAAGVCCSPAEELLIYVV